MEIYINVIDEKFRSTSKWKEINNIFNNQSPTWNPGIKLPLKTNPEMFELFVLYIALLYREYLINVVKNTRGYEKFWIPLSPKYLAQKKKDGRFENIWMNTGTLINSISISYNDQRKQVRVGIDEYKVYKLPGRKGKRGPKKTLPIILVAKWMEFGTEKMPSRPLFRRVRDYISKNIKRYEKDFIDLMKLMKTS
jgi:phage gpG-like protein